MISLAYVSSAACPITGADLEAILAASRINNPALDVTGLLLFREQTFLQVIEGPEQFVRGLYERIARDERHASATIVSERRIERRDFSGWSMGFENLDGIVDKRLRGYDDLLQRPFDAEAFARDPTRFSRIEQLTALFRVHA